METHHSETWSQTDRTVLLVITAAVEWKPFTLISNGNFSSWDFKVRLKGFVFHKCFLKVWRNSGLKNIVYKKQQQQPRKTKSQVVVFLPGNNTASKPDRSPGVKTTSAKGNSRLRLTVSLFESQSQLKGVRCLHQSGCFRWRRQIGQWGRNQPAPNHILN